MRDILIKCRNINIIDDLIVYGDKIYQFDTSRSDCRDCAILTKCNAVHAELYVKDSVTNVELSHSTMFISALCRCPNIFIKNGVKVTPFKNVSPDSFSMYRAAYIARRVKDGVNYDDVGPFKH